LACKKKSPQKSSDYFGEDAIDGDVRAVRFLLKNGVNPNTTCYVVDDDTKSRHLTTVFMLAISNNNLSIARLLAEHPKFDANKSGFIKVVKLNIPYIWFPSSPLWALSLRIIEKDSVAIARILIQKGADLSFKGIQSFKHGSIFLSFPADHKSAAKETVLDRCLRIPTMDYLYKTTPPPHTDAISRHKNPDFADEIIKGIYQLTKQKDRKNLYEYLAQFSCEKRSRAFWDRIMDDARHKLEDSPVQVQLDELMSLVKELSVTVKRQEKTIASLQAEITALKEGSAVQSIPAISLEASPSTSDQSTQQESTLGLVAFERQKEKDKKVQAEREEMSREETEALLCFASQTFSKGDSYLA
jgi:hypothetical protein